MRVALLGLVAILGAGAGARAASADTDLCAPGLAHRGQPVDLDVKTADIRAVLQIFADTARLNLVMTDDVVGRVTVRLRRVAWDEAACSLAALQHLTVTRRGNILAIAKRP